MSLDQVAPAIKFYHKNATDPTSQGEGIFLDVGGTLHSVPGMADVNYNTFRVVGVAESLQDQESPY